MRNLFLVLVLVNLVVLAYFQWVIERPEGRPPYRGPGITLLREIDRDMLNDVLVALRSGTSPAAGGATIPDSGGEFEVDVTDFERERAETQGDAIDAGEEQSADLACASIGPYLEAAEADEAIATLVASGFEPARRLRAAQVWQGYQVYIDQAQSETAARDIAATLRDSGVDATPVFAGSNSRTLVSVGIFPDMESATAEAERVGELGYEAKTVDSMAMAETYWLDVTLSGDQSVSMDLLREPGTISRLEQLPCTADGAD
ncbi:MAG: hypothetical protein PVH89_00190 [Gammaproteobacteria bacterium]